MVNTGSLSHPDLVPSDLAPPVDRALLRHLVMAEPLPKAEVDQIHDWLKASPRWQLAYTQILTEVVMGGALKSWEEQEELEMTLPEFDG